MNRLVSIWAITLSVLSMSSSAWSDPGLLLIAHGSPSEKWNKAILSLGEEVSKQAVAQGTFKATRTALMEFAKPDIPAMIEELQAEGCDRIVAVPLFIAPSGHSHFDVPAMLGIYSSPSIKEVLASEGAKPASPKVPIILGPTLSEGDLLQNHALAQVKKLSIAPKEEALVLISHGDPTHAGINESMMRRIATYCCGKSGIEYADWAFVGVGQEYATQALPVFARAKDARKRVIVVGLYVATSAQSLHERATKGAAHAPHADAPSDSHLVLSSESVIDDPNTARWVLDMAGDCIARR